MHLKILQGDLEKRNGIYYEYDPYSKPLGQGGMGVVFKGVRVNVATGARAVVAIKAMRDGLPDEVYRRAHREANIKAKNENLIEMLGFIVTQEQELGGRSVRRYYVISEFLSGVVLTDILKGNFKDYDGIEVPYARKLYSAYISDRENTSVQIIKRVLAGIMSLHDKGYIHRDIDPSNIMVTKDGGLKIIDFGIAKDVVNLNSNDGLHSKAGKFIGKAEYAAPELVLGDVRGQSFTTDIYAIGILFYQLLVGTLPFTGTQYEVLQKQLNKNVPVALVPYAKFRSVIKKATAKKQSSRYQSCMEMRVAIDNATSFDWKPVGRVAVILMIASGIGFGGYKIFFGPSNVNNPVIEPLSSLPPGINEQFSKALALLNSESASEVKEGWENMHRLAMDSSLADAKREIGTIMFVDHKVSLSKRISSRRSLLEIASDESQDTTIYYLSDIEDDSVMTGEALVALGISYYRKSQWNKSKNALKKALPKLEHSSNEVLYNKAVEYLNYMQ